MSRQFEVGTKVRVIHVLRNYSGCADRRTLYLYESDGVDGAIVKSKESDGLDCSDVRIVLINGWRYCISVDGLEELPPASTTMTADRSLNPRPIVTAWAGGDNPVPGKRVKAWLRNEWVYLDKPSNEMRWDHWDDWGAGGDILYYKVLDDG